MTRAEAIARLRIIASADITTRKPVAYLMKIAEACNEIGLAIDEWPSITKSEMVLALHAIGAEKMRDTAREAAGEEKPIPGTARPRTPETPPQTRPQRPAGIITAQDANDFLRGLPRICM